MVVLSGAILTSAGNERSGKTLLARQFVEMSRLRVEGLMSAFSKLVDSGRDHTFIETESVRYIYQPMESLYLVIVTNKASNILEDLETLRLLAKVVQDCCEIQVNEEQVLKKAFNIIFAFDEVISFGHRESVTLSQIKTYTEMDSHEEKLHQMIEISKINEAREMAKKKQMELAKARALNPKESSNMPGIGSGDNIPSSLVSMANIGGGGMGGSMAGSVGGGSSMGGGGMGGGGGGMETSSSAPWSPGMDMDSGPAVLKPGAPRKGMTLGKKRPGDMLSGMGIAEPAPTPEAAAAAEVEPPSVVPVFNPLMEPVRVDIEEKITAECQLEGGLNGEAVCTGEFKVTVLDAAKADLVCFKLNPQNNEYKYKVHPNLNKASHANNILEVREPQRAFKANQPAPLLKWQLKSSDDNFLPVSLSCWPTPSSDGTSIVLELELTDDRVCLEDIQIRFPAAPNSRPNISSAQPGEAAYDAGSQQIVWQIASLDRSDSNGTLEFTAFADTASLMPFVFEATRRGETSCPMNILECYHQQSNNPISFHLEKACKYELRIGA